MKRLTPKDPTKKKIQAIYNKENARKNISSIRNEKEIKQTYNEADSTIKDFYTNWNKNTINVSEVQAYEKSILGMTDDEIELLNSEKYFYEMEF